MRKLTVSILVLALVSTLALAGSGRGGGSGIDLGTVRTVSGPVTAVSMEQGQGHPGFTMSAEGGSLEVHLGPYWYLVAQGFSVAVGDQVTATVASCTQSSGGGYVVALQVANATNGSQVVLRDENGKPVWKGRRHGGGQGGGNGQGMAPEKGKAGKGGGTCKGSQVDLSTLQELAGTATVVNGGLGTKNNTITFNAGGLDYSVALGPFWYLQQHGFAIRAGDALSIRMAQCSDRWVAFSITLTATGQTLQLRDDSGYPLWLK
jgi:hypothetical protein